MVEGLIAALLLAVILVGILPLIDRARQNNLQGNDATYESSAIIEQLETLYSLPFDHVDLTIVGGGTVLDTNDYFLQSTRTWTDVAPASSDRRYSRFSRVEYFAAADLENELTANLDGTFDDPLVGTSSIDSIQFKRITLELTRQRIFDSSPYRVVAVKAY